MKKLITIGLIAAALATFAKTTATVGTNEVDAIEYCTQWANTTTNEYFNFSTLNDVDADVLLICDDIISKKGAFMVGESKYKLFPKCAENYKLQIKKYQPSVYANICAFVDDMKNDTRSGKYEFKSFQELDWILIFGGTGITDKRKETILKKVPRAARLVLRKQGKSFVDKDGVSPVKPYVDAVSAALNAPRYAGLKEALAAVELDYGLAFEFKLAKTDEKITELKQQIFVGDVAFSEYNQKVLKANLGVEEYNKFVKEYNGDK